MATYEGATVKEAIIKAMMAVCRPCCRGAGSGSGSPGVTTVDCPSAAACLNDLTTATSSFDLSGYCSGTVVHDLSVNFTGTEEELLWWLSTDPTIVAFDACALPISTTQFIDGGNDCAAPVISVTYTFLPVVRLDGTTFYEFVAAVGIGMVTFYYWTRVL